MSALIIRKATAMNRMLPLLALGAALLLTAAAHAAAPGMSGNTFNLTAQPAYITQPDGQAVYSWGYGCTTPTGHTFVPATTPAGFCNTMQVPGPTLVVTEGQQVSVTLTNGLPASAGNTSILFPGFNVTTSGGVDGLLTKEASQSTPVTYTFTPGSPRPARARTTAARRATCRSRWACMGRSSSCPRLPRQSAAHWASRLRLRPGSP